MPKQANHFSYYVKKLWEVLDKILSNLKERFCKYEIVHTHTVTNNANNMITQSP